MGGVPVQGPQSPGSRCRAGSWRAPVHVFSFLVIQCRYSGNGESRLATAVQDKTIVMGSTDTHEFALLMLDRVFSHFDAKVVNLGVDLDAEDVLRAAAKEKTPYIVISTHNGVSLDWGKRLMNEAQ